MTQVVSPQGLGPESPPASRGQQDPPPRGCGTPGPGRPCQGGGVHVAPGGTCQQVSVLLATHTRDRECGVASPCPPVAHLNPPPTVTCGLPEVGTAGPEVPPTAFLFHGPPPVGLAWPPKPHRKRPAPTWAGGTAGTVGQPPPTWLTDSPWWVPSSAPSIGGQQAPLLQELLTRNRGTGAQLLRGMRFTGSKCVASFCSFILVIFVKMCVILTINGTP